VFHRTFVCTVGVFSFYKILPNFVREWRNCRGFSTRKGDRKKRCGRDARMQKMRNAEVALRWEDGAVVNSTQGCRRAGALPPCPFKKKATAVEVPFHDSIVDNFMFYQDKLETNLLQLFAHPDNSEWFSIIFAIIFEINIVAGTEISILVTIIFLFIRFHCLNSRLVTGGSAGGMKHP